VLLMAADTAGLDGGYGFKASIMGTSKEIDIFFKDDTAPVLSLYAST